MAPSRKRAYCRKFHVCGAPQTAALLLLSPRAPTAPSPRAHTGAGQHPRTSLLLLPLPASSLWITPSHLGAPTPLHPQPPAAKPRRSPLPASHPRARQGSVPSPAEPAGIAPRPLRALPSGTALPPPPPGARRGPGSGSGSAGFCLGPASPPSLPPSRPL